VLAAFGILFATLPATARRSGGGGGGGGQGTNFSGNWSGTITTSFGTGLYTMRISQSGTALSGSAHFGATIFDSTLKLATNASSATQFSGFVSKGEGSLPITGTISADVTTISGMVVQGIVSSKGGNIVAPCVPGEL